MPDIDPRTYHDRTTHRPERYAASLGYLDWANQPDPFRRFVGAPLTSLPHETWDGPDFADVIAGRVKPAPLDRTFVARLLYHSLALSAWKAIPNSRWSLRVNPSSGNLHPTEGYVICGPIAELAEQPTLFHYAPKEHGLEHRASLSAESWQQLIEELPAPCMLVGLTSIHWRESWKYGERAYRYCQHDAGHAIGAVAYAAACLGWRARLLTSCSDAELADLLGTAGQDGIDAEHPDCLLVLYPNGGIVEPDAGFARFAIPAAARTAVLQSLAGIPNKLSSNYHPWPVIDEIATACAKADTAPVRRPPDDRLPDFGGGSPARATDIIRGRRSAVAMDGQTSIPRDAFYAMLDRTLPGGERIPHATLPWRPRVHFALFVHRVDGLAPGLYVMERSVMGRGAPGLRVLLGESSEHRWERPPACPEHLPLYLLQEADARPAAKASSCHQDIAADGCFAIAMLAELGDSLAEFGPWFYRALHWEAGLVGQTLYLEAERAGIRSTGIGCFFDDLTHQVLGYEGDRLQVLYHFTVGGAVDDPRLQTLPAYE